MNFRFFRFMQYWDFAFEHGRIDWEIFKQSYLKNWDVSVELGSDNLVASQEYLADLWEHFKPPEKQKKHNDDIMKKMSGCVEDYHSQFLTNYVELDAFM